MLLYLGMMCDLVAQVDVFHFHADTFQGMEQLDLSTYAEVYVDSTGNMSLEEVQKQALVPFDQEVHGRNTLLKKPYPIWYHITISPTTPLAENEIVVKVAYEAKFDFYETDGQITYHRRGGYYDVSRSSQVEFCKFMFPLSIKKLGPRSVWIRSAFGGTYDSRVFLMSYEGAKMEHALNDFNNRIENRFIIGLIAILFFLGLFMLFRYIQIKQSYIGWYGLYLIFQSLYTLQSFEQHAESLILWNFIPFGHLIGGEFLPTLSFVLFCKYLVSVLELDSSDHIYKTCRMLVILSLVCVTFQFIFYFSVFVFGIQVQPIPIFLISGLIVNLGMPYVAVVIWRRGGTLSRLIGAGTFILSLGVILAISFTLVLGMRHWHLFFEVALLIEILLLTQAVGYKMKKSDDLLINTKHQLLIRETESLDLQRKLNEDLTKMVEEKTTHILEINKEIAERKKQQLAAEFNRKLADSELKALKSQMNPHFIFNCLNAIRSLVQHGENKNATYYLTQFAGLIRKVLSYSDVKLITLEEELELCQLYLEMEQLRFEDGFQYKITVDPNSPIDFVKIPPMILQPLLENAIWHGLLHKTGNREVSVTVSYGNDEVICVVEDNGVGRNQIKLQQVKEEEKKSFGMKLLQDRLKFSRQLFNHDYSFDIIDKFKNGEASGTKVELKFSL
jgi:signal transduction histidine kinase